MIEEFIGAWPNAKAPYSTGYQVVYRTKFGTVHVAWRRWIPESVAPPREPEPAYVPVFSEGVALGTTARKIYALDDEELAKRVFALQPHLSKLSLSTWEFEFLFEIPGYVAQSGALSWKQRRIVRKLLIRIDEEIERTARIFGTSKPADPEAAGSSVDRTPRPCEENSVPGRS